MGGDVALEDERQAADDVDEEPGEGDRVGRPPTWHVVQKLLGQRGPKVIIRVRN